MSSPGSPQNERFVAWLQYFEDLGLDKFYVDRAVAPLASELQPVEQTNAGAASVAPAPGSMPVVPSVSEPKPAPALAPFASKFVNKSAPSKSAPIFAAPKASSLFESADRVVNETLEDIRADIGDCTRCRLCEQRKKIVFGDGSAKAELVFIGEGPGRDEDIQGIPFVGRAGQLLTQMIEAMGLHRQQVYICNVVKCRPPENRTPEKDEVATCSPFLFRQLDVIKPKVIVCLGNCAAQALLNTTRPLSSYRGEWLEFRGTKLLCTYHPAYLLRNPHAKPEVWTDLKKVLVELGLPIPKSAPKK
jgi:uracil-DNA glycosylase